MKKTLEIANFSGRITRIINGDLNSGFSKFSNSWGYDPFSKPLNLTWLEQPVDITGPISGLPLTAKTTINQTTVNNATVFLYDSNSKLYGIQPNAAVPATPNVDSVVSIGSIASGTRTYSASMDFFGNTLQVYLGLENNVHKANFDGSSDTVIGATGFYLQNRYRPLKQFAGKLRFGNGHTFGTIDATGTVTSPVASVVGDNVYSDLNPPLPPEQFIQDLDATVDGNYMVMTAAGTQSERIDAALNDLPESVVTDSGLFRWNGSDEGVTAFTSLPDYSATALQTYLGSNLFFANDPFGMSVNDEEKKILMLPNNKSPLPNATCTNGNFLTWWCPEVIGTTRYASLYYFGSLDQENPTGLYRVLRWATTQSSAQVFQASLNLMVTNSYKSLNQALGVATFGYGKHYLGASSVNTSGTLANFLLRFLITPTGSGTPQLGVYETQTQIFSKRIGISQIRVYTEATTTGNGFQLDIVGADGAPLQNGTFSYAYGSPINTATGSLSLERINFNPDTQTVYSFAIRITNTGTANMTIKKIEIDISDEGK